MNPVLNFGRWVFGGSWRRQRPDGSSIAWGRLVASWFATTFLVALMFALLALGGFLGGVAVALLFVPAQVAVTIGLIYAARTEPRRTS